MSGIRGRVVERYGDRATRMSREIMRGPRSVHPQKLGGIPRDPLRQAQDPPHQLGNSEHQRGSGGAQKNVRNTRHAKC